MRILILLIVAMLAGCAHDCPAPPAPRIVDTSCSWLSPMSASSADTPETKREVIAYEIARQKNCPQVAK
ncbi:hypothetical protein [Paraburkholderia silvatlantica]|uniref:Lipoprotein YbaY n=1 Tax=Paraburkholderia silvatlantica TaxID=321895 RepID=A0ABR6FLU1_9BURK|nr:hypothetical protein [Paraburkholderia silvatlantica]MBB2928404.1 putative lipoprotein YbaY [Paraburkholderia silvatlantica]PVY34551.1 hypothetical protein C7411_10787 [Paraburkholderia silvatlantica]PXW38766.1 hypothetical protein C7413_10787 [Paraburkholderia silvatlantica]